MYDGLGSCRVPEWLIPWFPQQKKLTWLSFDDIQSSSGDLVVAKRFDQRRRIDSTTSRGVDDVRRWPANSTGMKCLVSNRAIFLLIIP